MSHQASELSPSLFFNTLNAYQRTEAIRAAIELDIFTAIGEGINTAQSLAEKRNTSERGIRILCDYLVILGFLNKDSGRYSLTPDSAMFLSKNSPGYAGEIVQFLVAPTLIEAFKNITNAVKKGGTAIPSEGSLAPEHPMWVNFARGMGAMMAMPAQLLPKLLDTNSSNKLKVLDISASHGLFGIAFAQNNPNAEIVGVDWANVLEVAKENAEAAGVGDRYSTIAGSAFDVDFGKDYDLVLLPNFLHHFDTATCESLLKKIHSALAEGGRVVTLEFIPNDDRVSPPDAAAFSLVMLATTPSGDAYTFKEYEQMFSNAGFSRNELHPLPPITQQVIISYK